MRPSPPPLPSPDVALELARRFGLILAGLGALVARGFLRRPALVGLIVPLFGWLSRSVRRFGRAMARPVVARAADGGRARGDRAARLRLPAGRGWLVRVLGYEAVGYGSQLEALLAEPEMVAVLAAVPAVGRILRPLCRMLGVGAVVVAPAVKVPVAARQVGRLKRVWTPASEKMAAETRLREGAWNTPGVAKVG